MRGMLAAQALVYLAAVSLFGYTASAEPRIALVVTNQGYKQS